MAILSNINNRADRDKPIRSDGNSQCLADRVTMEYTANSFCSLYDLEGTDSSKDRFNIVGLLPNLQSDTNPLDGKLYKD